MTNNPELNSDYYREKAVEIRRFAGRATSADVRFGLLDLADRFDRDWPNM